MSSGNDKLSEKQGIQSKEVQGSNQGKAWLSTSMFRDRQPNEGLSDVIMLFMTPNVISRENDIF